MKPRESQPHSFFFLGVFCLTASLRLVARRETTPAPALSLPRRGPRLTPGSDHPARFRAALDYSGCGSLSRGPSLPSFSGTPRRPFVRASSCRRRGGADRRIDKASSWRDTPSGVPRGPDRFARFSTLVVSYPPP